MTRRRVDVTWMLPRVMDDEFGLDGPASMGQTWGGDDPGPTLGGPADPGASGCGVALIVGAFAVAVVALAVAGVLMLAGPW